MSTTLRRLQPHDPVPETGRYLMVMRRFAEDEPSLVLTELITADGRDPPQLSVPTDRGGQPLDFEQSVAAAQAQAEREGFENVYVVDRTAGPRERDVLSHHGDHSVHMDRLVDEDGDRA
ncbi:MAG: hypothetical protein AB7F35_10310 [Acetobacteraceae bacterium]